MRYADTAVERWGTSENFEGYRMVWGDLCLVGTGSMFFVPMSRRDEIVNAERYNYFVCPNCGNEVRVGAAGCPHCGSDEKTGWKEDAHDVQEYGGYAGHPDFDYDDFVRKEFGGNAGNGSVRISPRKLALTVAVTLIAIAFLMMILSL